MRVYLNDLEEGDEILVPVVNEFRRYKILRTPKISTKNPSNYVPVKVAFHNSSITSKWRSFDPSKEDFNDTHSFDLNYKMLWLIKKGEK